ncbi:hypothetical protein DVH26_35610 [Paenibacillus sp. H1-7]|nr:hypothetical protein DVH26_35610 [Paenibacillus sp. H1-7]
MGELRAAECLHLLDTDTDMEMEASRSSGTLYWKLEICFVIIPAMLTARTFSYNEATLRFDGALDMESFQEDLLRWRA